MPVSAAVMALMGRGSGGERLDEGVRVEVEPALGADLTSVRVHRDAQAQSAAAELQARAFTVGAHIFVGPGESPTDLHLMAHEAAHVVQNLRTPEQDIPGGRASSETSAVPAPPSQASGQPLVSGEPTYDLNLRSFQGTQLNLRGVSRAPAVSELLRFAKRLRGQIEASKYGHSYLAEVRSDQPVVAFFSDLAGFADFPPLSVWDSSFASVSAALITLGTGDVMAASATLEKAVDQWRTADKELDAYREGTIRGAERAVVGLEVTEMAGAVAATVATGGLASGFWASAGVAAATAGGYGVVQSTYQQASEIDNELRSDFDVSAILRRGVTDAATAFVGSAVGGAITQRLTRAMGSYLGTASPALLRELGEAAGMAGPLPADAFVTAGQRLIADLLGGAAAAPFTVATRNVIARLTTPGLPLPTLDQLIDEVAGDIVTGATVQVLLAALHAGAAPRGQPPTEPLPAQRPGAAELVGEVAPRGRAAANDNMLPSAEPTTRENVPWLERPAANDNVRSPDLPPANDNVLLRPDEAANDNVEQNVGSETEIEWARTGTDDYAPVASGGGPRGQGQQGTRGRVEPAPSRIAPDANAPTAPGPINRTPFETRELALRKAEELARTHVGQDMVEIERAEVRQSPVETGQVIYYRGGRSTAELRIEPDGSTTPRGNIICIVEHTQDPNGPPHFHVVRPPSSGKRIEHSGEYFEPYKGTNFEHLTIEPAGRGRKVP